MERRKFTREFKLEAVRLIKERGVSYSQASQDLGVHQSQLRGWVKALADDPQHAFPGPRRATRPKAAIVTRPPSDGHYGRKAMEWFSRKTSIVGVQIPNWILVVVAVVVIWIIYTFTR